MADNYLERKMEEYRNGRPSASYTPKNLDALAASLRYGVPSGSDDAGSFDPSYKVHPYQLQSIISIWNRCAISKSAGLNLVPFNSDSNACIIISPSDSDTPVSDLVLGMAAQMLMLKAAELGLTALILSDFPADQIPSSLAPVRNPYLILAIGKSL